MRLGIWAFLISCVGLILNAILASPCSPPVNPWSARTYLLWQNCCIKSRPNARVCRAKNAAQCLGMRVRQSLCNHPYGGRLTRRPPKTRLHWIVNHTFRLKIALVIHLTQAQKSTVGKCQCHALWRIHHHRLTSIKIKILAII